ncbi:MAG: hypothetical protein JXA44_02855 [Methanospirillaceae archaeon]|nr:hypothetical protein [Methanospirillaceae archaeon]
MVSEAVKKVMDIFYPIQDYDEAISTIVLEWLDIRIAHIEDNIRAYERKYGMSFIDFNKKIKSTKPDFEEEDDWIDWGDAIDLVQNLLKIRSDAISQLSKQ